MNQAWIYSPKSGSKTNRSQRHFLKCPVQLVLPFEVWNLSWNLYGQNISQTGILCYIPVTSSESKSEVEDLLKLLEAEPNVQLFLHSPTYAQMPVKLEAEWIRAQWTAVGVDLGFAILSAEDRLYDYISKPSEISINDLS